MSEETSTAQSEPHARAPGPEPAPVIAPSVAPSGAKIPLLLVAGVAAIIAAVVGLYLISASRTNHVAMAQSPKPVSIVKADKTTFRPARSYVGTIQPWNSAKVGPQFVSAYIGTVLVRPGTRVRRGDVLATLDCRESSAASREIAARAHALSERQVAVQHEASRLKDLTTGGFASTNEAEQIAARSRSEASEVLALRASLVSRSLAVDDCILRAPFSGEIAERSIDPGAYVRPGNPIVTVIDRTTVRIVADAPESDFAVIAQGTLVNIEVLSGGARLTGRVSRRAPAADEQTRTIHFEIDVPNADRKLPVGTTALLSIDVGQPQPATSVPLRSATLRGDRATLFVVEKDAGGDIARRVLYPILGEARGTLFLDPKLPEGTRVVIEGRALLDDGDRVAPKELQQ